MLRNVIGKKNNGLRIWNPNWFLSFKFQLARSRFIFIVSKILLFYNKVPNTSTVKKHQGYRPREEWIIQAEKAYQISVPERGRKGYKIQYLLSGLLKCQICGNNFQMSFDKRKPK